MSLHENVGGQVSLIADLASRLPKSSVAATVDRWTVGQEVCFIYRGSETRVGRIEKNGASHIVLWDYDRRAFRSFTKAFIAL